MAIKIKGRKAILTGTDLQILRSTSKEIGLSEQDTFTGLLWELIMRKAREGLFHKTRSKK